MKTTDIEFYKANKGNHIFGLVLTLSLTLMGVCSLGMSFYKTAQDMDASAVIGAVGTLIFGAWSYFIICDLKEMKGGRA